MKRSIATLFLQVILISAFGQAGSNDPTFNVADVGGGTGANGDILTLALQPDGKTIIGGSFTAYRGTARRGIARLNADGSVDAGFDPGSGANGVVRSCLLQPDGKILIGGEFTWYNGVKRRGIARLDPNGDLDSTFDPGTGINGPQGYNVHYISAFLMQPDGKIMIGGAFTRYDGNYSRYIARLNMDGTMDTTFHTGSGFNNVVLAMARQPDGKLIVGGYFTNFDGTNCRSLVRLTIDGGLDPDFDPGTSVNSLVTAIALQSDGRILIGGTFNSYNNTPRMGLARLNADASLDTGFVPESGDADDPLSLHIGETNCILVLPDARIIIAGSISTMGSGNLPRNIVRMNSDGSLDTTFAVGIGTNDAVLALGRDPDGNLLIAGAFTSCQGRSRKRVARLDPDGPMDIGFNQTQGPNKAVNAFSIQPDGKIIIAGEFKTYCDQARHQLARLTPDGSLDAAMNPDAGVSGVINCTLMQPDGKIIVAGDFDHCNGMLRYNIARLNPDGTLDAAFDPWPEVPSRIHSLGLQSDGKIIVGGWFTQYASSPSGIVRLEADGGLDTSFNASVGYTNEYEDPADVLAVAMQPDGKIIIGGIFDHCNGASRQNIARLNGDGSLDATFDAGTGANGSIRSILVQPNGKINVAGSFSMFNGQELVGIARLNINGSTVGTFNPGSGAFDVESAILLPDGKLIIAGGFDEVNGMDRGHLARLNNDGSVDPTFDPGTGTDSFIFNAAMQPDGNIIISGSFKEYDGTPRTRLARVIGCNGGEACGGAPGMAPLPAPGAGLWAPAPVALHLWPNPNHHGALQVQLSGLDQDLRQVELTLIDPTGRCTLDKWLPVEDGALNTGLDLGPVANGIYVLHVHEGSRTFNQRVVVDN
jgi:uncharacterized delta-60 repeat protein